jgi:hypothetical protein
MRRSSLMSNSGILIDGKPVPIMGKSCLAFDMFIKQNLKSDSVVTYINTEIDSDSIRKRLEQYCTKLKGG